MSEANLDNNAIEAIALAKWFAMPQKPVGERSRIFEQNQGNKLRRALHTLADNGDMRSINSIFGILHSNPDIDIDHFMNIVLYISKADAVDFYNSNYDLFVDWLKSNPRGGMVYFWVNALVEERNRLENDLYPLLVLYSPENATKWKNEVERDEGTYYPERISTKPSIITSKGFHTEEADDGSTKIVHEVGIDFAALLSSMMRDDASEKKKTDYFPKVFSCKHFDMTLIEVDLLDEILTLKVNINRKVEDLFFLRLKRIVVDDYGKDTDSVVKTLTEDGDTLIEVDLEDYHFICTSEIDEFELQFDIEDSFELVDHLIINMALPETVENVKTTPEDWHYDKRDRYWDFVSDYNEFQSNLYRNPSYRRIEDSEENTIFHDETHKLNAIIFGKPFEYLQYAKQDSRFEFIAKDLGEYDFAEGDFNIGDTFFLSKDIDGFSILQYSYSLRRCSDNTQITKIRPYDDNYPFIDQIIMPLVEQKCLSLTSIELIDFDSIDFRFLFSVNDEAVFNEQIYADRLEELDKKQSEILAKKQRNNVETQRKLLMNKSIDVFVGTPYTGKVADSLCYRYYWSTKLNLKVGHRELTNLFLPQNACEEINSICNALDTVANDTSIEEWLNLKRKADYYFKEYKSVYAYYRIEVKTTKAGKHSFAFKAYFENKSDS